MHPAGGLEEVAEVSRQHWFTRGQPPERRLVDRLGMHPGRHLGQLLRVSQQQQPPGADPHGQGLGHAELTGLVDDEQVELVASHATLVGEVPGASADDVTTPHLVMLRGEGREVVGLGQGGPRRVGRRLGDFAHLGRIEPGAHHR